MLYDFFCVFKSFFDFFCVFVGFLTFFFTFLIFFWQMFFLLNFFCLRMILRKSEPAFRCSFNWVLNKSSFKKFLKKMINLRPIFKGGWKKSNIGDICTQRWWRKNWILAALDVIGKKLLQIFRSAKNRVLKSNKYQGFTTQAFKSHKFKCF